MHPGTVLGLPRVPQGITPLSVLRQNCELWLRSDRLVGLSGSDVLTWGDLSWKGHNFSTSPGSRATYNLTDANWGDRPSLDLDGVQLLMSDDVADTWKFLHDGTGGGIAFVYRASVAGKFAIRTAITGAEVGMAVRYSGGPNQRYAVYTGASIIVDDSLASPANTNAYGLMAYEEGRPGNEYINRLLGTESLGNSSGAPSAASPTTSLAIGWSASGFVGQVLEVFAFSVYPTAQQLLRLRTYIYTRYGLI